MRSTDGNGITVSGCVRSYLMGLKQREGRPLYAYIAQWFVFADERKLFCCFCLCLYNKIQSEVENWSCDDFRFNDESMFSLLKEGCFLAPPTSYPTVSMFCGKSLWTFGALGVWRAHILVIWSMRCPSIHLCSDKQAEAAFCRLCCPSGAITGEPTVG